MVGGGISAFAVAFISMALMRVVGQPLMDQLPPAKWGADQLRDAGEWLVSAASVFWIAATATAFFVYWFARRASVTRGTTANVCLSLAAGILAGAIVSMTRATTLTSAWSDPALWLLAASYLMPVLVAILWWTVPILTARIRARIIKVRASAISARGVRETL